MLHMVVRLGPVNALLFCLLSTGISAGTELLGTKTGIIFGSYHYTEIMGPKIFGTLPALIPLVWLVIGYCAVEAAEWLFAWPAGPLRLRRRLAGAVIAAFMMTSWDLVMDPVTVAQSAWFWHGGGAWFGIPISNYTGWLLTSLLIQVIFAVLRRPYDTTVPHASLARAIPVFGFFFALTVNSFGAVRLQLFGPAFAGFFILGLLLCFGLGRRA